MLAGLLFADHEAVDRPGQLTATLPFGGVTLIEYQARLLMAAGAAQIVVVVGRLTPELLGATGRIARRGIAVDTVRGAEGAAAKLHPLARVVVLADGLITTQDVVDRFAGEGGDALLVAEIDAAPRGYERLGGGAAWAGVARLDARRIAEVAGLPRDYDFASTLLRLADQARADHLLIGGDVVRDGHGIEHSAAALSTRGRAVLAATVADRRNWFNALILAPLARAAVPKLIARATGTAALAAGGVVLGLAGTGAVASGWIATGMVVALVASLLLGLGRVLAILRDEATLCRWQVIATGVAPALVAVALGFTLGHAGDPLALPAAVAAVFLGVVGERATLRPRRRRWWGSPPAYLLVATVLAIGGAPLAGLVAATLYAAATLAAAVETLRPEA